MPTKTVERAGDLIDTSTLVQVEHERNVLEDQPFEAIAGVGQQAKRFFDETGVAPVDSLRTADLAEVLARKARRHHLAVSDGLELPNVVHHWNAGEMMLQDALGHRIGLA
jgi:hypothetical protein